MASAGLFWLLAWSFRLLAIATASPVSPTSGDYPAPFDPGDPDLVVPNRYCVGLTSGYTLEQYWATIGQYLSEGTRFTLMVFDEGRVVIYHATILDEKVIHDKV